MQILCFGSLNIDHVYRLSHIPVPGETLAAQSYARFPGGKGLNQSIALARAGAKVRHAGCVGADGGLLLDTLGHAGVDTSLVRMGDTPSGHAVISVDAATGQNAIVIYAGANGCIREADMDAAFMDMDAGDWVLLQNEVNGVPGMIKKAKARGLRVAFNPAPMHADVKDYPLSLVDMLVVNETEAMALTDRSTVEDAASALAQAYPAAIRVLTLGAAGSRCFFGNKAYFVPACRVQAADTTGAGDTYTGYFLALYAEGLGVEEAMQAATRASAICVTRQGAAPSIPARTEVFPF